MRKVSCVLDGKFRFGPVLLDNVSFKHIFMSIGDDKESNDHTYTDN